MEFNELKEKLNDTLQKLKTKVSDGGDLLVEFLSTTTELLVTQNSSLASQNKAVIAQNETLIAQNKAQGETIEDLQGTIKGLQETIKGFQETVKELQRQLNMNSSNSSKPSSTDGYKHKNRSTRTKSGKKPGGQNGHTGANMKLPHEPDEVQKHVPQKCKSCPHLAECLASNKVFTCGEKRYEVEAVITTKVIEHQAMNVDVCPCGEEQELKGEFPDNIKAYVQYGNNVTVLAGILSTYGAVSYSRIQGLLNSLLDLKISQGTLKSMVSRCAKMVNPAIVEIKDRLTQLEVVNFDETGVRSEGKLFWVHNSSNGEYTYQTIGEKRGVDGITENGVLPNFQGTAVHDCWAPYWKFDDVTHAICCAHLLRELNGAAEFEPTHTWSKAFKEHLLKMKQEKEQAIANGQNNLTEAQIEALVREYDEIMAKACEECPPPDENTSGKRGRQKKGKVRCLIERLLKFKDEVCLFIKDFAVPFDNNQAERDVRNVKTKAKVSGCFRSREGAQDYLDLMSYLSTARKHGVSAVDALRSACSGNPEIIFG